MNDPYTDKLAAVMEEIPKTYEHAVRVLAAAPAIGPDRVDIYVVPDSQQKSVRLIEVSATFPEGAVERRVPPNRTEVIVPVFPMGPSKDYPFRSEIAQVTPSEWKELQAGTLRLNREWGDLKSAREVEHVE